MKEYVITISVRDRDHPLSDQVLVEAGQHDPATFVDAVQNLADALRCYRTPEKLARAMREHKKTILLPAKGQ